MQHSELCFGKHQAPIKWRPPTESKPPIVGFARPPWPEAMLCGRAPEPLVLLVPYHPEMLRRVIYVKRRNRVFRMLQIGQKVCRRAARESLYARILYDGLVELLKRQVQQRYGPAIVHPGIATRRRGGLRVGTAPLNIMSYFS